MSYPQLPSNGEINWGSKFLSWANAVESNKAEGAGLTLRHDTTVGTRVFLDRPGYPPIMLHGDTGWRDVTPPLPDRQMTAGRILLRRVNSTLMIWLRTMMYDEMTGPTAIVAFESVVGMATDALSRTTFDLGDVHLQNTDEVMVYGNATYMSVRWMGRKTPVGRTNSIPALANHRSGNTLVNVDTDVWPTALPGIPA